MRGPCAPQAGDHSPNIDVSLRSRQKNKFGMAVVATLHHGRKSSEVCSGRALALLVQSCSLRRAVAVHIHPHFDPGRRTFPPAAPPQAASATA